MVRPITAVGAVKNRGNPMGVMSPDSDLLILRNDYKATWEATHTLQNGRTWDLTDWTVKAQIRFATATVARNILDETVVPAAAISSAKWKEAQGDKFKTVTPTLTVLDAAAGKTLLQWEGRYWPERIEINERAQVPFLVLFVVYENATDGVRISEPAGILLFEGSEDLA